MKTIEKIENASNMMDIQGYIYSDVYYKYCSKFAEEGNPFNRSKETQENWHQRLMARFGNEMKQERIDLFNLIPSRFEKCFMYKKMKGEIFA
jgi:hypothetical protein